MESTLVLKPHVAQFKSLDHAAKVMTDIMKLSNSFQGELHWNGMIIKVLEQDTPLNIIQAYDVLLEYVRNNPNSKLNSYIVQKVS